MQRTLLALALIASFGVSYAQAQTTVIATTPTGPQAGPTNEPRDPYGNPLIGRNDWVAQPGDRTNAGAAPRVRNYHSGARTYNSGMNADVAQAQAQRATPMQSGQQQGGFKDEYGHRYDAQGNRLNARGNIISPQTR